MFPTISLVLSPQPDLTNHTGSLISSIASGLQGSQFHMNVTPFAQGEDMMKPIEYIVQTRSADAVIINQIEPEDKRVLYMQKHNFPFVTHGRTIWCDDHPYYDYDNGVLARLAIQYFAKKNRKNVLLIAPPREQHYATHMIAGAEEEAAKFGLNVQTHPYSTSDMGRVPLTNFIAEALEDAPHIDAIFSGSTSGAMAAVAALERLGRTLTVDIDVFAKEVVPILDWFRPGIEKVYEDVTLAGNFLAQAAMQAVRDPDKPPMQCLEQPKL